MQNFSPQEIEQLIDEILEKAEFFLKFKGKETYIPLSVDKEALRPAIKKTIIDRNTRPF